MTETRQQLWLRDQHGWAILQERMRHDQALLALGEYSLFTLMWTDRDFEAGIVARCTTCQQRTSTLISEAYHQASSDRCPDCFGTTFEGGWKAQLVRPAIWMWSELALDQQDRKGAVDRSTGVVDTTTDFRLQPHDYVFRGDGSRYKVQAVDGVHLDTGFGVRQMHTDAAVNYTYSCVRANPSDPGYSIGPDADVLVSALTIDYGRYPVDFSALETVKAGATLIF